MKRLSKRREDILRNKDWSINEEQLKIELKDFDWMAETLNALIYNVFWLGKVYLWTEKEVEKMWQEKVEEIEKSYIEDIVFPDIKDMETKEEIIEYLKE